jgi:dipeptidyl aminopeptidase/acylaminoacyl peptidase
MFIHSKRSLLVILCLLVISLTAVSQQGYRKPPQEVLDILNAPVTPTANVSPARDKMLLATGFRNPPLADLAQPMLRLAGLRINPNTNGPHRSTYFVALSLKQISTGADTKIELPPNAKISAQQWSADGKHFAFTNATPSGIELWVGDTDTGKIHRLKGIAVNSVEGVPFQWMPDNQNLLVQLVPAKRGLAPATPTVPREPNSQESSGKAAPIRTYEDLLKTPHDEDLFEYYATAQLALVDSATGRTSEVGAPAIYDYVDSSPDGQHLLIARIHRPFSYIYPDNDFPKEVEVLNLKGKMVYKVTSQPMLDSVPIDGVPTGPRTYRWHPVEPATLVWVEALDEGNPKKQAAYRDRVMMLAAPFTSAPTELIKTEQRLANLSWFEKRNAALVTDYDRDKRWVHTVMVTPGKKDETPKEIWSRNIQDRYKDPGTPLTRLLPNGHRAIQEHSNWIYLVGPGASPEGERPFLDRLNLETLKSERMFRSESNQYESFVALINEDGTQFVTRHESPSEAPNYFLRTVATAGPAVPIKSLTNFPDATPQLRGITKQLVTYKRADGVQCSFTLYLPPGYKQGTRLPTVVWAYPLEFNDPGTAGQVTGSTQKFTQITGPSHLFFLLEGYAILDNTTMPVVGNPETVNNTYVEQIVMSAKAAIDKATEMGVTDPNRVGVGGHSYGAFMTGNLLAHSDLFRAGIARSGAYNRSLTPFGFQSERRTFWEAPEMYMKVSPFMYADKIKDPILLIHGEADDNQGTFPIQSERMYQAIRGNGGTVRYVTLPLEAHGYSGRETIEHVLYEMIGWFDKYVKNAPPRTKQIAEK